MGKMDKPLVRVAMFLRGRRCYAFFDLDPHGEDFSQADWESHELETSLPRSTPQWYIRGFAGCLKAFRRLQARHPDKDMVLTADELAAGELPLFGRGRGGNTRFYPG